ncbi:hypothetical protein B0H13DRAFT_1648930 [Mycena leptocephala]|nr:hypothetical protein B0H13DRAFT_1648930 [Mycena leptocephala]
MQREGLKDEELFLTTPILYGFSFTAKCWCENTFFRLFIVYSYAGQTTLRALLVSLLGAFNANLNFGWCAITAHGDYTKGRLLWDCQLILEFLPGTTILIPCAALFYFNIPIEQCEQKKPGLQAHLLPNEHLSFPKIGNCELEDFDVLVPSGAAWLEQAARSEVNSVFETWIGTLCG